MINIQFNHHKGGLMRSFNATDEVVETAKSKIFFHTISRPFLVKDLYGVDPLQDDDESLKDVPIELRTVSGVLEKCLASAVDEVEQLAMLIMFHDQAKTAQDMVAMYLAYKKFSHVEQLIRERFPDNDVKAQIAMLMFQQKVNKMAELEELFQYVQAANGSYDIFASIIPDGKNPIEFLVDRLHDIIKSIDNED